MRYDYKKLSSDLSANRTASMRSREIRILSLGRVKEYMTGFREANKKLRQTNATTERINNLTFKKLRNKYKNKYKQL